MRKVLELDDRFPKTGEPTIQLAAFTSNGRLAIEKRAFAESRSPIYDFLATIQPEAGATYLLVNALGAYEFYDDNRNGDAFPSRPVRPGETATCGHPECSKPEGWISDAETLIHHYPTFEKHGGIFRHHVNKDPSKSLGFIVKAVWNPFMHRVELLLKVINERAEDLIGKVGAGEFPAVSMGCHVRWDVCTICGHRAPTRAQYCDHARNMLRRVLPDGRKCSVLNPSPKFFDISFVFRPADPTGWMLKKVAEAGSLSSAELGELIERYDLRAYEIRQSSEKIASALQTPYRQAAQEIVAEWPVLDGPTKTALASVPLNQALSTLASHGVLLSTGELADVMAKRANTPLHDADRARVLALQPVLEELVVRYPDVSEKLGHLVALSVDAVKPALLAQIQTWVEKRASVHHYLRQKAFAPGPLNAPIGPGALYRAVEPAKSDVLTLSNPYSGEQWQTTRGAAMEANNADARNKILGSALLGALYTVGLKSMLGRKAGLWSIPAGIAAGVGTKSLLDRAIPHYRHPHYMTDQGIPVSGGTDFYKVSDVVHREVFETQERNKKLACLATDSARWLTTTPLVAKLAQLTAGAEYTPEGPPAAIPSLDLAVLFHNACTALWP
jgi:hypothetical protein